jgi:hypothetical protein
MRKPHETQKLTIALGALLLAIGLKPYIKRTLFKVTRRIRWRRFM